MWVVKLYLNLVKKVFMILKVDIWNQFCTITLFIHKITSNIIFSIYKDFFLRGLTQLIHVPNSLEHKI